MLLHAVTVLLALFHPLNQRTRFVIELSRFERFADFIR